MNPSHSEMMYDLPLQLNDGINDNNVIHSNVMTERATNHPAEEQQPQSECGESTHTSMMSQSCQSSTLNESKINNPSLPANSVRKASQIVESTQNFMNVLESCTKNEVPAPFYHQRRGGIKV